MGDTFNITRFVNDTSPIRGIIEVNNNYVDLTDYEVYFYYDEIQPDGSIKNIKIKSLFGNVKQGEIAIYPKIQYSWDITDKNNPVNCKPFTIPSPREGFDYSIIRTKTTYEKYDKGEYVLIDDNYVTYDPANPDHQGLTRYTKFVEKHTHRVGKLIIMPRVGE